MRRDSLQQLKSTSGPTPVSQKPEYKPTVATGLLKLVS